MVESKWLYGWYRIPIRRIRTVDGGYGGGGGGMISRVYHESDKVKAVEEMVRTHMLAGHTADDLVKSEDEARSREEARFAEATQK